jgi:hypothetical protein
VPTKTKTKLIRVNAQRNGTTLGTIKWYAPWRQYCFFPADECIFNVGCMMTIVERIDNEMRKRKNERENTR